MITIGERVGSYRVVRALGSGGMGMVFEAEHEAIRSRAAIKVLHSQYSENPDVRARFFNEALATNLVQHPGIVSIFEHGQLDSGAAYIVMEFLRGESLRERIDKVAKVRNPTPPSEVASTLTGSGTASGAPPSSPPPSAQTPRPTVSAFDRPAALRLLRQLASAMAAAHSKRIVHRDLKPENVMIVKDPFTLGGERVKVLDFGIAKVLGHDAGHGRTGGVLGTPAYMAPEAWEGAATVDEKVDVYALGIILFELLTGRLPLPDARNNVIKWQHVHESVKPQSLREVDPSVPEALDTLAERMLEKRSQDRPDMAEVSSELEKLVGLNLRYRAGGFVREGEFYARRGADDALFYALLNGQSCHVLGPRQIGKTSLLHSVVHRLNNVRGPELERGILCAVLDLLSVESSGTSAERFYFELVRELYRGLGIPGIPTDFWVKNQDRAPRPSDRFALLLRELPLHVSQPAVIFVDHIEVLLRLPLPREEFFTALWAAQAPASGDAKAREKGMWQLALCLLGTAQAGDLMPEERRSPFVRSRPIPLADLTNVEARALLPGLHRLGDASEKAMTAVLGWTSGHPYLTQCMCEALATKPLPDGSIQHLVDSVAAEVVAKNRRREDASFAFAEEGVRDAGALRPALLRLYRQVVEGVVPDDASGQAEAIERLLILGMVRREEGVLAVRNRIFSEVFSLDWLRGEEAVRPLASALLQWQTHHRQSEYLLPAPRLREALAWSRGRQDLSPDEQAFLGASAEHMQQRQRRRIALLLAVVLVLFGSLVGTGLLWRNVKLAKQEIEAQQARTEVALNDAERARKEADNARNKSEIAFKAAEEARKAADEARAEMENAVGEAAKQRDTAKEANLKAKLARDRAFVAAHAAEQAGQTALEAGRRADEANQTVGRTLTEKAQAIAALEGRIAQCDKDRRICEIVAQRLQSSLDGKEIEAQNLRGNVGTLNTQIANLKTDLTTANAQLSACKSSEPHGRSSEKPAPAPSSGTGDSLPLPPPPEAPK